MARKKKEKELSNKEAEKKLNKSVVQYNKDIKKRKMLKALEQTKGLVLTACKKAKVSRSRHYVWYKEDEDYKAKVDAINELMVEGVESKLAGLIDEGNTAAIIFYLKSKAKDKGYGNQVQVDAKVEGEVKVNAIFNQDLLKDLDNEE